MSLLSRSRKIRCDSSRPNCQNCIKRGNECVYDKVPKRRGPDKRPGTRKRSCKKRQSDGSDPQPKKKQRGDPVDQGTPSHAGYNQYEISPVAVPLFGSAQHKSSKVDIEPPTASSSLAEATASYHETYYVKVSSVPLFLPPLLFITLLTAWILLIHQRDYHLQLRHTQHRRHIPQRAKFSQGSRLLTLSSPISVRRNPHTKILRLHSWMRPPSGARIADGGRTFLILTPQHVSKRM